MAPVTPITQANRLLKIDTPLGGDVLMLDEIQGREAVSELYQFELSLVADAEAGSPGKVTPDKVVGQGVTVSVTQADGSPRYIHGIVQRFSQGQVNRRFATYKATIVPKVWLLTLNATSRIFTGKSVPDVLAAVLTGFDVKFQLSGNYLPWDYCVQYRETDFNFISRLMEEEGIWYYFKHANGSHQMVITDAPSSYESVPGLETAWLDVDDEVEGQDTISSWNVRNELFSAKWTLRDHHLELTGKPLESSTAAVSPWEAARNTVVYDFPGGHAQRFNDTGKRLDKVQTEADRLSKLRMEETESAHTTVEGDSVVRSFVSGFKFKVDTRTLQQASGNYVLTSVQHWAQQTPAYDSNDDSTGGGYRNHFTCTPADKPLRPERVTPKPMIHGLQSAEVVAESAGEEIWPDKYGRVRVKFAWDLEQKYQCWVPVSQQRAGKQGGFIWIPRVGDEVMVAYMEGDPDNPVIVGSLYNGNNLPPYELPANKTQSGIKTRSTKGGAASDFNELRFEDLKDKEEIFMQAQKNLTTVVKNDETRTIHANRTTTIQKDDKRINKEGDEITLIEKGSKGTLIKKDFEVRVEEGKALFGVDQGDFMVFVEKGIYETQVNTGDASLLVNNGNLDFLANKNMGVEVAEGAYKTEVGKGDMKTEVKMGKIETKLGMGDFIVKCDLGSVKIEAMKEIELKVGQSSIKLSQQGIEIKGMMTKMDGTIQTEIKGLMTKIDASAMLQAKGSITMIG